MSRLSVSFPLAEEPKDRVTLRAVRVSATLWRGRWQVRVASRRPTYIIVGTVPAALAKTEQDAIDQILPQFAAACIDVCEGGL